MCKIATLMKRAPAKVAPKILNLGFDLNAFDLIGNVPTNETIAKNRTIKKIFSTDIRVDYYIFFRVFNHSGILIINYQYFIVFPFYIPIGFYLINLDLKSNSNEYEKTH